MVVSSIRFTRGEIVYYLHILPSYIVYLKYVFLVNIVRISIESSAAEKKAFVRGEILKRTILWKIDNY